MTALGASFRRIDDLSQPKPIPLGFIEDRRSVYWIDRYPPEHGQDGITVFAGTPRLGELSRHKRIHDIYQGDRPTPIWPVSSGAQSAEASERVKVLALSRPVHRDYRHMRSVYTDVTPAAKSAEPSDRLHVLAQPKPHKLWANSQDTFNEGEFSQPITGVPLSALRAKCAPRVEVLAETKREHPMFRGERPVQWPVTDTAMNAIATLRLQQLARPKSGKMVGDDFNPYRVSLSARLARASPRVCELATPIPRKVRGKKV